MAEEKSLLAYLVPKLTTSLEDTATEALAFILNKSALCRDALNSLLRDGDFSLAPIALVRTQISYPYGQRPDMVGYDGSRVARLLVESNFGLSSSRTRPSGTSASWMRRGQGSCSSSPRRSVGRRCGPRLLVRWKAKIWAGGWWA